MERTMAAEEDRTRLIGEIANLLSDASVPEDARSAGLILIGWLARRMPGEVACTHGVEEMTRRAHALQSSRSGPDGRGDR
ncbi:MAG TPA: hypothetical protein VE093_17850 [Polyangiaceae bacterium]|nr:hypothetical protein [Polyangiaceae bacterium]